MDNHHPYCSLNAAKRKKADVDNFCFSTWAAMDAFSPNWYVVADFDKGGGLVII